MLITEKRLQTYTTLVYVGPVSMMLWRGGLNFYLYLMHQFLCLRARPTGPRFLAKGAIYVLRLETAYLCAGGDTMALCLAPLELWQTTFT